MPWQFMTFVTVVGIVWLFALDRDKHVRTSAALWIPVAWMFINCSRSVTGWLGVFGLGSPFSQGDQAQTYLEGSPIDGTVFIFLFVAGVFVLVVRTHRLKPVLPKMGPILLFYSYCAISILWSVYPFVALKHWVKGVGDVVMVLIVVTDPEPVTALKRLFSRVGFVLIPLSVLFIKYIPNLGRGYTVGGAPMYTGVTTQKNSLGVLCLVFGLGSLWRFLTAYRDREIPRRTQLMVAHGTILVMVLWLLHVCDSMTSFSCLIMAGAVMILTSKPMLVRKAWVAHLLVAATVCLSLFALFFDSGGGLLQNMGRNSTLTGRTAIWDGALRVAGSPLIGTGYESFWLGERLQRFWNLEGGAFLGINEAHNGYLELYLNLGWIGVALLAGLILWGYPKVIATLREDPNAGSLGLAYFAATLAYNFTEAGFRMMFPLWIFFLLAIIGIPKTAVSERLATVDSYPTDRFATSKLRSGFALDPRFRKETH
jgi:exopolysaccharide production protein ExoQ